MLVVSFMCVVVCIALRLFCVLCMLFFCFGLCACALLLVLFDCAVLFVLIVVLSFVCVVLNDVFFMFCLFGGCLFVCGFFPLLRVIGICCR